MYLISWNIIFMLAGLRSTSSGVILLLSDWTGLVFAGLHFLSAKRDPTVSWHCMFMYYIIIITTMGVSQLRCLTPNNYIVTPSSGRDNIVSQHNQHCVEKQKNRKSHARLTITKLSMSPCNDTFDSCT